MVVEAIDDVLVDPRATPRVVVAAPSSDHLRGT